MKKLKQINGKENLHLNPGFYLGLNTTPSIDRKNLSMQVRRQAVDMKTFKKQDIQWQNFQHQKNHIKKKNQNNSKNNYKEKNGWKNNMNNFEL